MTRFVDTNIFLRYLTRDDPRKAEACLRLLKQAEANEVTLTTSETIIAEVVFVLASPRLYNLPRQDVHARLTPLLTLEGLKLPQRSKFLRALDLYAAHRIDFEDALTIAETEQGQIEELYSYDTDFDSVAGVTRLEP